MKNWEPIQTSLKETVEPGKYTVVTENYKPKPQQYHFHTVLCKDTVAGVQLKTALELRQPLSAVVKVAILFYYHL